ncbi:hypothetical protein RFI_29234 [Reticulomyxa filosa]|uniref:Uncharacterized protein n=1 Tax=Reticulomyxa filosa TaxID=46433 RepID=X6M2M3_RETFI|nr:hypothetical protein RFI_29234 [Reticulomyxa filosa]|eukprot:ETO08154.1 hypothetical protein RFI_29234 [Reticulomyxa filosa]
MNSLYFDTNMFHCQVLPSFSCFLNYKLLDIHLKGHYFLFMHVTLIDVNAYIYKEILQKNSLNKCYQSIEFHSKFSRPEPNRKYVVDSENENIQKWIILIEEELWKQFELECKKNNK